MFQQIKSIKLNLPIICKLLHDVLAILLVFFLLALIADGLLPGIVSAHFGFYKIILLIFADIIGINYCAKKLGLALAKQSNKKITAVMAGIAFLLIFNSLLGMNFFLIFTTILAVFAIGYFLYQEIFATED